MKQKTSKKVSFVLAAALCAAIAVPVVSALSGAGTEGGSLFNGVYGSTFTAFAEESAAESAVYTMQTKGMYSLNNDYLLLTTNIDDVTKYKEVGYTVSENGEEVTDTGSDTYYESITFKTDAAGGTRTDTMAEIFEGNVVTGMIVTEIEYSAESSYSITPYLVTNEGEKESGTAINIEPKDQSVYVTITNPGSTYTVLTQDGENEFALEEGAALPALDVVAPEGYQLAGFFETGDPAKKYPYEGFSMPDKDLTVTPYFAAKEHRVNTPFGRAIDYTFNGGAARIHSNNVKGFGRTALGNAMSKTPALVGEGEGRFYAEIATYNYEGGVQTGWTYIGTTLKQVLETETYHFTYTFYNFGSETISFEAWQTNASSSPTAESNPHAEITLAPGASRTVEWSVSGFQNNNILLYFAFTADTSSDLSLGVNLYMDK